MTVVEFLEVGEDENCTDAVCAEDTVASLSDAVYNSLEGNEDSADEADSGMGQTIPKFLLKKPLRLFELCLQSNPDYRVALRVISQSQRELPKKAD